MNLLTDIRSLRIAPTVGREVAAQLAGLAFIATIALAFGTTPALRFGLPAAYAVYAIARVGIVLRRKAGNT